MSTPAKRVGGHLLDDDLSARERQTLARRAGRRERDDPLGGERRSGEHLEHLAADGAGRARDGDDRPRGHRLVSTPSAARLPARGDASETISSFASPKLVVQSAHRGLDLRGADDAARCGSARSRSCRGSRRPRQASRTSARRYPGVCASPRRRARPSRPTRRPTRSARRGARRPRRRRASRGRDRPWGR